MKKTNIFCLLLVLAISISNASHAQIITAIAGGDTSGYNGDNRPALGALLSVPFGIIGDKDGNTYFADLGNSRIRKVSVAGVITTVAGTGVDGYSGDGGPATAAQINTPISIAIAHSGNIYFTDYNNTCVRKIGTDGIISRFAGDTGIAGTQYAGDGGPATAASLKQPAYVAIDKDDNVFISENGHLRKVGSNGIITTIPGVGSGTGMEFDKSGNLYFIDGAIVYKLDTANVVSAIAGGGTSFINNIGDGGPATAANFSMPEDLACDADGNVYISDTYHFRVRKINVTTGIISSVAGTGTTTSIAGDNGDGGYAAMANLGVINGIVFDRAGNLLLSDYSANKIRSIRYAVSAPIVENKQNGIVIYPNPSKGTFNIAITADSKEEVSISVINIAGQKIEELIGTTNTATKVALDAPAGLYLVIATTATQRWLQQVMIQ